MADSGKSDTADTMPAEPADSDRGPHRATIPDIAPPFEQRYRLGIELGRGGMGRVVEAFDTQLGRTVALKEVLPRGSAAVDRRFEREVQITARLEHPSIVPLYDAGTMPDGRPFYVMRRVTGRPLDELLNRSRDLEERLVLLPNVLAALDAVAHAHKRGIIHRDLKPANILVGENGETIVIDWGLAKVIGEEEADPGDGVIIPTAADSLQTVAGAVFGTPGFMAPEQARGEELGPRSDVFALGATLYHLLAGRPPIGGKSATEAIASSIQRKIVPVAEAAPSAPVELVAIVEKALKFDPEDRYTNAGGLAEDVRRFLTGQVVAAHRYTRRQMIARFAKRHRAPLSVAALATVAVAVLAWIGVHRILVERDSANSARADAESERTKVLKYNGELVEQADRLLVTRARALLDTNPTAAITLLKQLKPTSARTAEARAIAQAAVSRGLPWALHAEGDPRRLAADAGMHHLAEITADGTLHIWDLETHRVLYERMYLKDADLVWIVGGKLMLLRGDAAEVLEPRTGALERVAEIPQPWRGTASEDGTHVGIIGKDGEVGIFDVVKRVWTPMWPDHQADNFEIAPDASWLAATDKQGVVVVDATGKVLAQRAGRFMLQSATAHALALFEMSPKREAHVLELDLLPTPTWHDDPMPPGDKNFPLMAYYRVGKLHVVASTSIMHYDKHALAYSTPLTEWNTFVIHDMANGVEVLQSRDGSLHFSGGNLDGQIAVPAPLANAHLLGRPGATRFVVAANGIVLVYDLADVVPQRFEKSGESSAEFIDDDTLLLWPEDGTFTMRDIPTGKIEAIKHEFGPGTQELSGDPKTGRVLLAELSGHNQRSLVEIQKGHSDAKRFGSADRMVARLVADGLIVAHDNDPRVQYSEHDKPFQELAKVDGGVQSLMPLDRNRFAALGRQGELVRGNLNGGPLERVHVDIDAHAFLGTDHEGNVLISTGTHLLLWDTTVHPFAELPRAAIGLERVTGGLFVTLDNNAGYLVDESKAVHQLVPSSQTMPTVGGDGTWIASAGPGGQIAIVELPSLSSWTLPMVYTTSMSLLASSPTKRRLVQAAPPYLAVFDLVEAKGDLGTWLDERTNAFENADGFVSWPWLRP